MNRIIESEYYEQRQATYLNKSLLLAKVDKINMRAHKTLMKTKEIHELDNGIKITIMNIKNAIYSNDIRIKIKLDDKRGYEFVVHMYKLQEGEMIKEEPVYIGNVNKKCLFCTENNINIHLVDCNINTVLKDVYGHKIFITSLQKEFKNWSEVK